MRNKKRGAVSTLVWIIFAVSLILLLVVYIFTEVSPQTKRAVNLEACRSTVATASSMRQKTSIIPPVTLNCPAPDFEYDLDKEEERVVVIRVATELSNCWYKTAAEDNRLGKSHGGFLFWEADFLSQDPNVCIVCSTFNLTKDIQTYKVLDYIERKRLLTTSWPEHYFVELVPETKDIKPGSYLLSQVEGDSEVGEITIAPNNDMFIDEFDVLEAGKKYYVISLHAPSVSDDYVHVFVAEKEKLDKIRCDIFFHEMMDVET